MAGPTGVTITGARELRGALRRFGQALDDPDTHRPAGEVVLQGALERVPVVSGDLADTLRIEIFDDGAEVVAGSALVPYAGVIEYGWDERGISAQPYIVAALDEGAGDVHDAYAERIGDLVERVGRES